MIQSNPNLTLVNYYFNCLELNILYLIKIIDDIDLWSKIKMKNIHIPTFTNIKIQNSKLDFKTEWTLNSYGYVLHDLYSIYKK